MVKLDVLRVRSYVAEPDRVRRDWSEGPEAQGPVYAIEGGFAADGDAN
jgi:hypothetical protein